jgi:hypothetical protein
MQAWPLPCHLMIKITYKGFLSHYTEIFHYKTPEEVAFTCICFNDVLHIFSWHRTRSSDHYNSENLSAFPLVVYASNIVRCFTSTRTFGNNKASFNSTLHQVYMYYTQVSKPGPVFARQQNGRKDVPSSAMCLSYVHSQSLRYCTDNELQIKGQCNPSAQHCCKHYNFLSLTQSVYVAMR